jgi:Holliday junction resolvase RusA-like endonuclease
VIVLLEFRVRGNPTPQPRPKARAFNGHAQVYEVKRRADGTTHPIVGWRQAVAEAARKALGGRPAIAVPVIVSTLFLLPRPGRLVWKRREMPRIPHDSKPDKDNLDKALMDALSPKRGAGAWLDDSLVCGERNSLKLYCAASWVDGKLVQEPSGALVQIVSAVGCDTDWEVAVGWKGGLPW